MNLPSSEQNDPFLGKVINGRFTILELIARGGMGRVYRARQEPLGREVALKVLDPRHHPEDDNEFQARFFLEASTAAKLSHPNTVTVFDYGRTADDIYFIAMELVEGKTLSTIVKQNGPIEPLRATHIGMQIARSLREAHQLGVIHRDLKPANVLVAVHADEESFVKVLDFGLVKDLKNEEDLTQQGVFMGSPKYMSPEQIQGGDIDHRSDIYSLGVILYYMLCGRAPFEEKNQVKTLMAHIKNEVPPMTRADGQPIPQQLQEVTLVALSKDPEFRYGSMNEVITALRHAAGSMGAPISSSSSLSVSDEFDASSVFRPSEPPSDLFGVPSVPEPLPPVVEKPSAGFGKPFFVLVALLLGAGALYTFVTSGHRNEPVVETADAGPTTTDLQTTMVAGPRCTVSLNSDPPGAEVFVGDRSYGVTPSSVEWIGEQAEHGREVTFRFVLRGHRELSVTRTILGPRLSVDANLRRIRRGMRPGPNDDDDGADEHAEHRHGLPGQPVLMPTLDPASFALDASRLPDAIAEINAAWKRFDPKHYTHEAESFGTLETFADLLSHYDYGEPDHNGTLNALAARLLVDAPTTRTIGSQEDLPEVESEYISYFHHGDLVVNGDFGAYKSIWITGDLIVEGVIENSYLDAFQDLIVGGDVRCAAISFMGLSMIGGRLDVSRFAWVDNQAFALVLGGVRGPFLIGETESVHDWDAAQVEHKLDVDDLKLEELAKLLETTTEPEDKYAFSVIYRAFDAARRDQ